jgi:hypothetical protein
LLDNPIVGGGGITDADAGIVAFDVNHCSFFLLSSIKHDPDFFVSGIRELFHTFHETTLRGFFPPLCAVTAYQDACVQDIEAVDEEEGIMMVRESGHELLPGVMRFSAQ